MDQHQPAVLIVEDDTTVRAVLEQYLTVNGITTESCASSAAMWQALDTMTPSVVLLDVELPDGDGFDLAHDLRRRYGLAIAIVMLTGRSRGLDFEMGMEAGVDDYLTKPCRWQQLVGVVSKYVNAGRWARH